VAALIFAVKPDLTYSQVRSAILDNVDSVSVLASYCQTGGRLNALAAIQAVYTGAAKTFIGDSTTGGIADDVLIRPKPGDSSTTQVMRFQSGAYQVFAELANNTSKRIDVYTLGAGDVLTVQSGVNNPIYASSSEGDDTLDASAADHAVTLIGEAGNDLLKGGSAGDSIEGSAGSDTIYGNAGADFLNGVSGDDWIYARYGTSGTSDADSVYGGSGNDHGQKNTIESVWDSIENLIA
jgi:Ca2+-binding RTX toxin-like protein